MKENVVEQLGQPAPEAGCHRSYNEDPGTACRLLPRMFGTGRNRSRTCDLFLVMEALVPTELCALRGSLAYSIQSEGRCEIAGTPSS